MKNVFILILFFLLIIEGISENNSYNYNSYNAVSKNSNLSKNEITSTESDQSAVYISTSGIIISDATIQKSSGDSSNTENSEFYGVNAAVLVQGGEVTITDGTITTGAKGANAICATNGGRVSISGTTITSTGSSSARGLHATFGGSITASDISISSTGGSCATLATDRGEGEVTCTSCSLNTSGAGSPLIYSTGVITANSCEGTASGSQMVVVEGKNSAIIQESSSLKCSGLGNRNNVDISGIFLYQSMSGDAGVGTANFIGKDSTFEIQTTSSVYSSAPMFFVTNTAASINLENCNFKYGSGIFLKVGATSEWGNSGSNGGTVTLNLINQDIEGDLIVDTISSLSIKMIKSSIKGKINYENSSSNIEITLDGNSNITLTGDSYISSLTNEDNTGKNIDNGSYTLNINNNTGSSSGNPSGSNTGKPSGSIPGRPSGSSVVKPSGSSPVKPSGSSPVKPSGSIPQKPSGSIPQKPSGSNSQIPSVSNSQIPSGSNSQIPSGSNSQIPSGSIPQIPSGSNSQIPSGSNSQISSGSSSQKPSDSQKSSGSISGNSSDSDSQKTSGLSSGNSSNNDSGKSISDFIPLLIGVGIPLLFLFLFRLC